MRSLDRVGCAFTLCQEKMSLEIPEYWRQFRDSSNLLNLEVEIPEAEDLSGVGADIEFFADDSILSELNEAYPGIVVQKDGFLPVGGCQIGTGDPYFIRGETLIKLDGI